MWDCQHSYLRNGAGDEVECVIGRGGRPVTAVLTLLSHNEISWRRRRRRAGGKTRKTGRGPKRTMLDQGTKDEDGEGDAIKRMR